MKTLKLDNLPTNYYNVAFSVAKYRELLGFENENFSDVILNHFLNHVKTYTEGNLFINETDGEGRYDRYSILISCEIAQTLYNAKIEIPSMIKEMLKKSASVVLEMANEKGDGICYGRSIGAYKDTAPHQITSQAHLQSLLNKESLAIAVACMERSLNKFLDFGS